jgi:hypothetical protein
MSTTFIVWLQRQQSIEQNRLISIAHCQPRSAAEVAAEYNETEKLRRHSEIATPSVIRLPNEKTALVTSQTLRRLVVIGNADEPSNMQIVSPAIEKYCERQRPFLFENSVTPSRTKMVRIYCIRKTVNDLDTWIGLFCDPKDCSSKQEEEAVAAAIARDIDVLMHAQGIRPDMRPRGPYLVEVDS